MAKKVENKKSVALNAADELGKKIRDGIRSGKFNFANKEGVIVARKFQKEGYSGESYVSKKLESGASVRIEFLLKDKSKAPRYFVEISYPGSVEGMIVKKRLGGKWARLSYKQVLFVPKAKVAAISSVEAKEVAEALGL